MAVILIVEDDVFIRDLAELIIQEAGHETLLASDVAEALLILNTPQTIDLLFTDIYLKKLVNGGLRACSARNQDQAELAGIIYDRKYHLGGHEKALCKIFEVPFQALHAAAA